MANTITGKIYKIYPTEEREYNGKTFYERNIVIDNTKIDQYTGERQWANFPLLTFSSKDKCNELDSYKNGDVVTISFEILGIKYNDKSTGEEKFFNKVRAYKIEKYGRNYSDSMTNSLSSPDNIPLQPLNNDDLPF